MPLAMNRMPRGVAAAGGNVRLGLEDRRRASR